MTSMDKSGFLLLLLLLALSLGGCASDPANASERAWRRGQCEQIVDTKMREKCVEQVDREFGRR
jgi:hypothetical protein